CLMNRTDAENAGEMNGQRAVIHRPRSEGIPPVPADRPLECGG
ncbi:MAG: hypothetical protein, partial [Olavius algarvensis Gamma 1 endosymbiont]